MEGKTQTERKITNTNRAPMAYGPFSQAVRIGNLIYVSGMLGVDPGSRDFLSDQIGEQTKLALDNLMYLLRAAGSSLDNVVDVTAMLADMDDFLAFNRVYTSYFTTPYPCRTVMAASGLPMGAKVQLKVVAAAGTVVDLL